RDKREKYDNQKAGADFSGSRNEARYSHFSAFHSRARIEEYVNDVGDEVCADDREGNDEEKSLHKWEVLILNGLEECVSHSGIVKDDFGQHGTAHDCSQRDRKTGDGG